MRQLNDLPIGLEVEVEHWGERVKGVIAEWPEWATMPGGRRLHAGMVAVLAADEPRTKLYSPEQVYIHE